MSKILRIAREEWRCMVRDRVVLWGLSMVTLLTLTAAVVAFESQRTANAQRSHYQALANHAFATQPDRHPHRVAHFGHFLFRPLNALAAFDTGIEPFAGNTLFLEAHRQNGANFGDVRQSSLLVRFGQLTPAFILQVLAPLLLIFVGHATVAREREAGTLMILLAQGIGARQIAAGKMLALVVFAALILLPAAVALLGLGVGGLGGWLAIGLLLAAYGVWLVLWCLGVIVVSTLCARARDALLTLLAVWVILIILLPRGVAELAHTLMPLPTRFENEIAIEREYLALADAHNPDDPGFTAFRDRVLQRYGVARVEDLPVNFKGLVAMEGERASSALFTRYADATFAHQQRQNRLVDRFGWIAPVLALRRLSMSAVGTDLAAVYDFLEQGETYRYALVQGLNRLQAEQIGYLDDRNPDLENRISHRHWRDFPEFRFRAMSDAAVLRRAVPAAVVLTSWLVMLAIASWWAGGRLASSVR